jgi:hypothetical protein
MKEELDFPQRKISSETLRGFRMIERGLDSMWSAEFRHKVASLPRNNEKAYVETEYLFNRTPIKEATAIGTVAEDLLPEELEITESADIV